MNSSRDHEAPMNTRTTHYEPVSAEYDNSFEVHDEHRVW